MKTLIVYNGGETGDCPRLYLAEGDLSHLDGICLSSGSSPECYDNPKKAELASLIFGEDGTGENPLAQEVKQGPIAADHVVTCVFVP
jgi:hypothetical protein